MNRSIRDFDWTLILTGLLLSGIGVLQIYSATAATRFADAWWKQIIFISVGLLLMWVVASIDYHSLLGQVPLLYLASIAGLILVLLVGTRIYGARRWITIFGFMFQVSEFVKLVVILAVARFLTDVRVDTLELPDFLKLSGIIAIPFVLVAKQPDLGTSLTYLPILAIGAFLAGLRWKYIVVIGLVILVILPAAWFTLKDYQRARLVTFVNPDADPRGSGYQLIQSRIAVGSGGMWGRGVTKGTQTKYQFLPVPHTDFILASFAEEHGFVGVVGVLTLYFILLMQIVQNAQTATDRAGMYICTGVSALLLFHVFVNVAMVVGNAPVTGIPLPLMSAGGSNTISTFVMLGLVNNVRLRRFVN